MDSVDEIVLELVFYRSGEEAIKAVKDRWPDADVTLVKVDDLIIPEGVEACSWSGAGIVEAVKRIDYYALISKYGNVSVCRLYEFWTASDSSPDKTNDLFFWDIEADKKFDLNVPVVDV